MGVWPWAAWGCLIHIPLSTPRLYESTFMYTIWYSNLVGWGCFFIHLRSHIWISTNEVDTSIFCNITGFLYEVVGLWLIAMDVSSLRRTRAQISCNFHSLFFVFNFLRKKREEETVGATSPKRLAPPAPQLQPRQAQRYWVATDVVDDTWVMSLRFHSGPPLNYRTGEFLLFLVWGLLDWDF